MLARRSLLVLLSFGLEVACTPTPRSESSICGSQSNQDLLASFVPERPHDPPGVPAAEQRGSPRFTRAPVVRRGPFQSIQVNVDAVGLNIVGDAANEPSIAVDPTNPDRMAIGWRQFDTVQSDFRQAGWGYTQDGGQTWTVGGILEPGVFRSDPVLEADADGVFYYNSLKVVNDVFTTDVFESSDGGMTWSAPTFAFGGDKSWMIIDRSGGIGDGHIYCAWNAFFSCCGMDSFNRSTDGGSSFSTPIAIPAMPLFGTLAVGPAGELYVAGIDSFDHSRFPVAKSTNAQDAAATLSFDSVTSIDLGGCFRQSSTGPNPIGLLGQVGIAVDTSGGPFTGDVYVLYAVDPPGPDPLDLSFASSQDGGSTWSAPVRINQDPPGADAWQWFPTMDVAPDGRIDVLWNDTSASAEANLSELFHSWSDDGGLTWSPGEPVSPMWDSHLGWPNNNKIGDYYDMVSDNAGASVAWAATFNGEQDVYFLRIDR